MLDREKNERGVVEIVSTETLVPQGHILRKIRYEKVGRIGRSRFTREMREPIERAYYICQTYNRLGKDACTSHKIEAHNLYNLVLLDIMEHGRMDLQSAEVFYGRLTHRLE